MALRKETVKRMKEAGFLKSEIAALNDARKPDNSLQDTELIVQSATFEHALESRRKWWENALKPKTLGGSGMTYREAKKALENFYIMKGRRKLSVHNFWSFLKLSYRPKEKIQTKRKFQEAITKKSVIGKTLGSYGERLKLKYAPKSMLKKCHFCRGTGSMVNLEGRQQMCLHCSGSGVERQRFI